MEVTRENGVRERIILVGDYSREDRLYVAKLLKNEFDFYFIEFLNEKEINTDFHQNLGKAIYWKDYADAYELLKEIKPSRILFYFIESYNHVALNVAAKVTGIPTFHLEHGVRFYVKDAPFNLKSNKTILRKISDMLQQSSAEDIFDKFKNKKFFQNTVSASQGKAKEFLKRFYLIRKKNGIQDAFRILNDTWRLPDQYISFSPLIYKFHQEVDHLPEDYPVHFIGIPMFDHFVKWKDFQNAGNGILFIDQPLHEQNLLGWDKESKTEFLKNLENIVNHFERKLFIKPHPWNDRSLYESLEKNALITIMKEDWDQVMPEVNTVLGFSSTMLTPFMAMEQITCFTMEMHPLKDSGLYSQFFLDLGACDAVFSFDELQNRISDRTKWHLKQKAFKEKFISDCMFKFDGRSSSRLKEILSAPVTKSIF